MTASEPRTPTSSATTLRTIKLSAIAIGVLMVAGIVALMILAAGKGEDIAGIVAPALFVTLVAAVAATVAAVMQKRAEKGGETKSGRQG